MGAFFAIFLSLLAIFLILLVLVQRGRGGGLAGALGGMGGSSAFGAKAGDVFTRITIVTASVWIATCLVALFWAKHSGDAFSAASPIAPQPASAPADTRPPVASPLGQAGTGGSTMPAPGSTLTRATAEQPATATTTAPAATSGAEGKGPAPDAPGPSEGTAAPAENP